MSRIANGSPTERHLSDEIEQLPKRRLLRRLPNRRPFRRWNKRLKSQAREDVEREMARTGVFGSRGTVMEIGGRHWIACHTYLANRRQAHEANVQMLAELLERNEVPYFVTPNSFGTKVSFAVEDEHWSRLLSVLSAESPDSKPYVGVAVRNVQGKEIRWASSLDDPIVRRAASRQKFIEVFQVYAIDGGSRYYNRPQGCIVERWVKDDHGNLSYEGRNARSSYLGRSAQVPGKLQFAGRELPTFEPVAKPHVFTFDEPVDLVYMWVDGADPKWRAVRDATIERITGEVMPDSVDDSRFRDNGEFRYSLRSVVPHLNWIRRIFIVTDDQVPSWLDTSHPKITMISHRELFGDAGTLPTFNSHAIGSRLHHIPDLAEHYLVFNDDIFLGREVGPNHFFMTSGISRFFTSRATLPYPDAEENSHEAARRNVVDILERDFGKTATNAFFHTPVPQLRSVMYELEDRYPEVFASNWNSQLRSDSDYEVNGWLHHYYGFLTGRSLRGSITYDYFDLSDPSVQDRLAKLQGSDRTAAFCINDSPEASQSNVDFVVGWLDERYPSKAEWEL